MSLCTCRNYSERVPLVQEVPYISLMSEEEKRLKTSQVTSIHDDISD
jgi:hypothetical protein